MSVIQVENLAKSFQQNSGNAGIVRSLFGRVPSQNVSALNDLSFSVEEGRFYSLLGRNGAGKTTAIKILCTLLLADSGSAKVAGYDVNADSVNVRDNIGVSIRGERSVYWRLSGRQNLEYFGQLYDLRGSTLKRRIEEVAEVIGLSSRLDDFVERYSMGMKQRLAIGCALIHRPKVLMLDEPTIGLDAASARNLRTFISKELVDREKVTILYTTHYMHEAEEMSDQIGILHDGALVAEGSPDEVVSKSGGDSSLTIHVTGDATELHKRMKQFPSVRNISLAKAADGTITARIVTRGRELEMQSVLGSMNDAGIRVHSFESARPSLEDAFVALTGGLTEESSQDRQLPGQPI